MTAVIRHPELIPPATINHNNPAELNASLRKYRQLYQQHSDEIVKIVRDLVGIEPSHRILETGCGPGTIAYSMVDCLGPDGLYVGFDIVKDATHWCGQAYRGYKNIFFLYLPVDVDHYASLAHPFVAHSAASVFLTADRLRFPFSRGAFDRQVSFSVFTHLDYDQALNYLREISSVLAPDGLSLNSFFVLDAVALDAVRKGRATHPFTHRFDARGVYTYYPQNPLMATGFEQDTLFQLYEQAGLEIVGPVLYGSWRGTPGGMMNQDIIVARRKNS